MEYTEFLKLVDYYDYTGQIKGGMVKVNPKRIFITSNTHPSMWYTDNPHFQALAFFRRITSIVQFHINGDTTDLDPLSFA